MGKLILTLSLCLTCFVVAANERLVTIDGAVTEIAIALGSQENIVGRDSTSLYPASIQVLPDVGYLRALSVEGVLSLKPSMILTTTDAGPIETLDTLKKMGVDMHILENTYSVNGVLDKIKQVGRILNKDTQAIALIKKIQTNVDKIEIAQNNPSVLFVMGGGDRGFMAGGQHTRADAMINIAGGKNAMASIVGYKPITPEAMLTINPDVIFLLRSSQSADQFSQNFSIKNTKAAKNNKIFDISDLDLLTFGPRIDESIKTMVELIK
ncbi:heme/hemin ABC transporter substrate-binding protein [Marinicellulosiphila megalodicopiae]|uniref:heme/hemin ABC transporter substrate-binding protein n=1 Tax=Marinicellulosiphila megalodicopiae TaxID=2724896 RepID=UPI003BB0BE39